MMNGNPPFYEAIRLAKRYATIDVKVSITNIFIAYSYLYKEKIKILNLYQTSNKIKISKSNNTHVNKWHQEHNLLLSEIDKILANNIKKIEDNEIQIISVEGINIGKKTLSMHKFCKRFGSYRSGESLFVDGEQN